MARTAGPVVFRHDARSTMWQQVVVTNHWRRLHAGPSRIRRMLISHVLRSIAATSSGAAGPAGQREQQRP
eukprot:4904255-Prymnesium_polylepis.1